VGVGVCTERSEGDTKALRIQEGSSRRGHGKEELRRKGQIEPGDPGAREGRRCIKGGRGNQRELKKPRAVVKGELGMIKKMKAKGSRPYHP